MKRNKIENEEKQRRRWRETKLIVKRNKIDNEEKWRRRWAKSKMQTKTRLKMKSLLLLCFWDLKRSGLGLLNIFWVCACVSSRWGFPHIFEFGFFFGLNFGFGYMRILDLWLFWVAGNVFLVLCSWIEETHILFS